MWVGFRQCSAHGRWDPSPRCVGRLRAVQRPWQMGPKPTVCCECAATHPSCGISSLLCGSNGAAPSRHHAAAYYVHWERRLFAAVCAMLLSALHRFCQWMDADNGSPAFQVEPPCLLHVPRAACCQRATPARQASSLACLHAIMIRAAQVAIVLTGAEAALVPEPASCQRHLCHVVNSLAECSRAFPRWMEGTCLPCREQ